ncbi:IS3 family transposase, partial [Deinococcus sp. GbtcB9]|uniref:IS3 family transposase n=1 Tax=Deinococcus sp. GbtcB9 TaxID=2824754 RepID=UPI001C300D11
VSVTDGLRGAGLHPELRLHQTLDRSVQESFFATLKTEMGLGEAQWGRAQTRTEVFEWIEVFYNRRRR